MQSVTKVYLAGGMKSDWQDKVKAVAPDIIYFDPRFHGQENPKDYTKWDLEHVAKSDLVFACFEKENPSGFGMSIEIGYAKALNIPIILVDEKQLRSWAMGHCLCDSVSDNLEDGLEIFKNIVRQND